MAKEKKTQIDEQQVRHAIYELNRLAEESRLVADSALVDRVNGIIALFDQSLPDSSPSTVVAPE